MWNYCTEHSWVVTDSDGTVLSSGAGNYDGDQTLSFNVGGPAPVAGCTDADACNYNADFTIDDGSCAEFDCANECGGTAVVDCAGECGGSSVVDACGECGGDGSACAGCYNSSWYSDGYCDGSNNTAECGYDGGDCCPGDCTDGAWSCSDSCANCIDPDSADLAEGGQCYVAPPPACEDTEITFTLSDLFSDGFEATLSFDGTDMTGNTGDSFTFCLVDGEYSYTYSCGNYCTEHSWEVTDSDGTVLSSGAGNYDGDQTLSLMLVVQLL